MGGGGFELSEPRSLSQLGYRLNQEINEITKSRSDTHRNNKTNAGIPKKANRTAGVKSAPSVENKIFSYSGAVWSYLIK